MKSGRTLLEEKLLDYGFNASKIAANRNFIDAILHICSENETTLHDMLNSEVIELKAETARKRHEIEETQEERIKWRQERYAASNAKALAEQEKAECERLMKIAQEEIKKAMEAETPEGRDAYKRFLLFKYSCNIKNSYDNKEFIKGAAMILAYPNNGLGENANIDMDELIKGTKLEIDTHKLRLRI